LVRKQQSLVRRLGYIVLLLHPTALARLFYQLHHQFKVIQVQPQLIVRLIQQSLLSCRFITTVTNGPPHYRIVLLLHKTIIVFAMAAAARKRQFVFLTVPHPVVVDELTTVV
jgi:hypothetical protein